MRLPYIPSDVRLPDPSEQAIVERVRARRGGELLELDRTLLHAPSVADGWNGFLGAIRTRTSLDASVRELAICRVAALNGAWYEWEHHAPLLRDALGDAELAERVRGRAWKGNGLDEKHAAVLAYTDEMTVGCAVADETFAGLRRCFDERETVEITATVAAYNTVSRFLVALDVGEMADKYTREGEERKGA